MSSSMLSTSTTDPFADVLQSLKTSLESVKPIITPITDVQTICTDISTVLDYANDVPTTLKTCQETLELLSGMCESLMEVPLVDVVAEMAADIFIRAATFLTDINSTISPIIDEVVSPSKTAFDDLAKAMREAANIISTIGTTLPDYINTVQILSFCLDIAQQIVPVLSGTAAEESTQNFINGMVTVRDAVAKVMQVLAAFTSGIATAVNAITSTLGSVSDDIQSTLQTVSNGLGEFEKVISPIKKAFDAIENAIAPVKWVLDAVECVVEQVLEPVVNAVLEATGINELLQPLFDQIKKSLGVKPLFDLLQQHINSQSSTQWQQSGGTQAVSNGSLAWSSLVSNLAQYDSRNKGHTYQLITQMIGALTNSPTGPGPFNIPDWPVAPPISAPQQPARLEATGGTTASSNQDLLEASEFIKAYQRTKRQQTLAECFAALQTIAQPATTARPATILLASAADVGASVSSSASALWVTDVLSSNNIIKASYDDVGLSNVTQLLQAAEQAKLSLQAAQTIGPQLVTNLQAYDTSRNLPTYFQEEMQDFATLFSDGVKVMDFLIGFDWAAGIFKDLEQTFKDQADAANDVSTKAQQLLQSGQNVDTAIQQVEAHEPTHEQFTSALQYIDQIASSAAWLGTTLQNGFTLDAKLNYQFSDRLSALQTQVNTDAAAALQQMEALQTSVTTAMQQASVINQYVTTYATKFTQLGADSVVVSEQALPGLSKGVQLCNIMASIIDPLSGILEATGWTPQNQVVSDAKTELSSFMSAMQNLINQQQPAVTNAFDFIASKLVPIAKIASDIDDINSYVSDQASAFNAATSGLSTSFDALTSAMTPTKTFDYQQTVSYKSNPPISIGPGDKGTGDGQEVTKQVNQKVANFFVDDDLRGVAAQLVDDMNTAALKAGLGNTTGGANP